ncbi:hypothetical protein A2789_00195 [Candidatus Peribacteria bacterium RIFCSPHIGHO2_01_FULL_54_22]|nr:MAG: hypothetical protein A2789_00195 [Candidatus Peribacteria bacterium RIFCSPHIGHO2_01_FULL_54_22]OGJ64812.1 MAG: hypothetical protein A3E47_00385 [Candidatus Peribacteria bacterium RIFCSPHIGHO2_12_FULL_54_10]
MNHKADPPRRYRIHPSNRYERDIGKLKKSGANLQKLEWVIDALVAGKVLPDRYKDHELRGILKGIRECHIAPDWLLMYRKDNQKLILLLVRIGNHRDALGIK